MTEKNNPLVSVVIPTYNLAHYIVETLESVLKQTYQPMEIIIIDDGSQDNTEDILAPYMDKIVYVYQENRGISRTYNRGIEMAKGELICLLEADDYWITDDKVEKQVAMMQDDPTLDYVLTGWKDVTPDGTVYDESTLWKQAPDLGLHDWLFWVPVRQQCTMIKKSVLQAVGGYDPQYRYAMDVDLFLKIVVAGYRGGWLKEITTAYRIHPDSTSHTKRIAQADEAIAIHKHYTELDSHPPEIKSAKKVYAFFRYMLFTAIAIRYGFVEDAVRYAKMVRMVMWFERDTMYDLACYLGDSFSYRGYDFDQYDLAIQVIHQTYDEIPDTIHVSRRLSIETDTLLHWWLSIWWRYYHYMTPENIDTPIHRHPSRFKAQAIATYANMPIDEIVKLVRLSIYLSPLGLNDRTLPAIELFWQEMREDNILSANDEHRLTDMYLAIAVRAMYSDEQAYMQQAINKAREHSHPQKNWGTWVQFNLSRINYRLRKLLGQT